MDSLHDSRYTSRSHGNGVVDVQTKIFKGVGIELKGLSLLAVENLESALKAVRSATYGQTDTYDLALLKKRASELTDAGIFVALDTDNLPD